MVPPSYMRSVLDRNVVMWRILVLRLDSHFFFFKKVEAASKFLAPVA